MSKKVLSFVLSVLLIMNVVVFTTTAAPAPDAKGTAFYEASAILTDMGIMSLKSDGNFDVAGDITVGEYMDAVLKLIGIDASEASAQARFSDVPATHAYAKQVEMAYQLNIYKGKSADAFGVDDKLTMGVAIQALINATGYREYAMVKGGYPYGYAVVANEKDIIKNAPNESTIVTRGIVADMIYNALYLYVMVPSTDSNGQETLTEDQSRTILSSTHGAYKETGYVTTNSYVTLPVGKGLPTGNVVINGSIYTTDKIDADKYLGYYVTAIYTMDKGYRSLIALSPSGNKNNILTFDLADIEQITPTKVVYFPEGAADTTEYELRQFAAVLDNYSLAPMTDSYNYAIPDCGEITLIDNNNDDVYDVVLIDSYQTIVVSGMDKANSLVYGKYTENPIDLSLFNKNIIKDPTGKIVKFADIKKGDIAMVKTYPDSKLIEIQLLRTMETVNVDEITLLGTAQYPNKIKFKAADKEYEVAANFYKATSPSPIELAAKYDIYLDSKGKIANATKKGAESLQFGYLVKGGITSTGIDKTLEVMIYTLTGEFKTLKSGEKLTYSGEGTADGKAASISTQKLPYETVHKYLFSNNGTGFNLGFNPKKDANGNLVLDANGSIQADNDYHTTSKVGAMAIRYRLADDGTLLAIETAYKTPFVDGFRVAGSIGPGGNRRYKNVSKSIGGVIMMGADTKVLDVASGVESDKKTSYSTKSSILNESYYSDLYAYSTTLDSAAAQYIVHQTATVSGTIDENDPAYVFVKYADSYDPTTDKSSKSIVVYDNGDFVSYPVEEASSELDAEGYFLVADSTATKRRLAPGDVIRFALNGQSQAMKGTQMMFDATAKRIAMTSGANAPNLVEGVVTFYGTFFRRLGNGGYAKTSGTTLTDSIYNFDTAKSVIVVDLNETREARQFAAGSVDDIKTEYEVGPQRASKVFAFIREGAFKAVVVYK